MEAAAAGYAEGVLKSSVGKLGSLLLHEALLIASVWGDNISIRHELQSMDAVLRDLLCAKQLNQQNKVWMLHVLQVACEAELCIDEFVEILGGHCGHGFSGAVKRAARFTITIYPRHRIAKKIQDINVRAKELSERRARYNTPIQTNTLDAIDLMRRAHEASQHQMQNWHLIAEDDLVGISTEAKEIASKFGMTVISGPAGSGKTALAKMVYRRRNDPGIGIQASAWVTLSKNHDPTVSDKFEIMVLKDILMQIKDDEETENHTDVQVIRNLIKNHLNEKRFLLVFDSVREDLDLKKLKEDFLPMNSKGTIVVTTRKTDVRDGNTYDLGKNKFTYQLRKELCAKLLLNLTSATQSKYQWLINIGDFCWMIWRFFKRIELDDYITDFRDLLRNFCNWLSFRDRLRSFWNWLSKQRWFQVVWKMIVFVLIMYLFFYIVISMVRFYIQNWVFTLLVLVLLFFVQNINKYFTGFLPHAPEKIYGEGKASEGKGCQRGEDEVLDTPNQRVTEIKQNSREIHHQSPRRTSMYLLSIKLCSKVQLYSSSIVYLGSVALWEHPLEFVIVLSISSLVIWNLFQGQIWLALFKATHIVVWLVHQLILSMLFGFLTKSEDEPEKREVSDKIIKTLACFYFVVKIYEIFRSLYKFLCRIISRVVSFLATYIVGQVERIVYKYLTESKVSH